MKKGSLITINLILVGAIAVLGYLFMNNKQQVNAAPVISADDMVKSSVAIPILTTNLTDGYIQLAMNVQTDSKDTADELSKRIFQVNSEIIRIASTTTREEMQTKEGKAVLKTKLKNAINSKLSSGNVVDIYFTDFIIQ